MSEELESFVGESGGDDSVTVETTAESQVEVEGKTETDTSTDTSTKGVTDEPPASTDKPKETMIPLAAKQAEKEKRKQAETERDNLRLELARLQGKEEGQQKQAEPAEIPDPYTNPEEYTKYELKQAETRRLNESNVQLKRRLLSAEEVARADIPDYDEKAKYFAENLAPNNPEMIENMKAAPDPAKYAYLKGKQAMEQSEAQNAINQAGGLEAYEQTIRDKVMEEMKNEPVETKIPPDLTSARNAGSDPKGGDIADGTDGLNQLLGR